jgi:thiol:disulfide interchange protein DsbD
MPFKPTTVLALPALAACLLALQPSLPAQAQTSSAPSASVTTPQVRAELVAHAPDGVAAGKPLWLGLKLVHKPQWHTYWKNPGDSGLPTTLEWTLPAGVTAGEIAWPTPHRLPIGPLMNYGYDGTLLLPVAVTVPAGFNAQTLEIKLRADWLVCKEVCIPEGGDFVLQLPAQAATAGNAADFDAARRLQPTPLPDAQATAELRDGGLQVRVAGLPAAWQGKALQFFSETAGVLANAAPAAGQWQAGNWQATLPLDPQRSAGPALLAVVLRAEGVETGVAVAVKVNSAWPPLAASAAAPLPPLGNAEAPAAAAGQLAGGGTSLGLALLLALAGGALLNLMPCVFPVLSLKVLGFAQHAGDRRQLLAGGLAYTAGVVLSFIALAGLLLALRAGGEQLGWGFQLQSPAVVAVLAALFTLIGLNLAGVFEMGSLLPSSLAAARARHPLVDSALTGVLAVAVASPCTAPFMGASLGLAITLPTVQALTVFAALGLGMALPYLAASAWPALARALPRPGVWMLHFKTVMAFPMFATVVWLVWVLGQQAGIDGAAALLGLLLALAFAAWAFGAQSLGPRARGGFGTAAVLLLAAALFWGAPALRQEAVAGPQTASSSAEGWQPWSAERVAQAQAEGRPVFVDFTAAWCVTCQFNKRTTLASTAVVDDFRNRRVLLLRADWTRRDPLITAELARFGRNGVPVYLVYAPGSATPRVLSEILSVDDVRGALAGAPG